MRDLIEKLAAKYGRDKIRVCTQYHIQVITDRGPHNIWNSATGYKMQLVGSRKVIGVSFSKILKMLGSFNFEDTELHNMEEAVRLTNLVSSSVKRKKNGIFVDAGWKLGEARIASVMILDGHIKAESFIVHTDNNIEAEEKAIEHGLTLHPFLTIFSDCQGVVNKLNNPRVVWISRDKNISDKIGNQRNEVSGSDS